MLLLLLMILTKQDNDESEREGQMLLEISCLCFLIDWLVLSLVVCALIRFRLDWPSPAE